jgi:hypothetical protein
MAMTLDQRRSFAQEFEQKMRDILGKLEVILCAPATAMSTLSNKLHALPLVDPGTQNS